MVNWEKAEEKAYIWFKENIDSQAKLLGNMDSTISDIYSPRYNSYIEVKDITNGARCGQFTESTISNNPFAQAIYDGKNDSSICREFVKYHYNKKGISHFIIIDKDKLHFYPFEAFFNKYTFEVQNPYKKRSGTRHAPKKDIQILLNMDSDFYIGQDGYIYCGNDNRWGEYFSMTNLFDYYISKTNQGELRKRSTTENLTWHLLIK